jgi:cobalt-zinc-cadmium resistance protein CzcA
LAGIAALLILALIMFSRLGGEFIPRLDEGDLSISLVRLPSISLSESQKLASEVERRIMKFEEVKTVVSHTGRAEISTDPMGVESSDVFVILHPKEQWKTHRTKAELLEAMNNALSGVPGIGTQFLQPIEMRMNELIAGVKGDVAIKIFGSDFSVLNPAAQNRTARACYSGRPGNDCAVWTLDRRC